MYVFSLGVAHWSTTYLSSWHSTYFLYLYFSPVPSPVFVCCFFFRSFLIAPFLQFLCYFPFVIRNVFCFPLILSSTLLFFKLVLHYLYHISLSSFLPPSLLTLLSLSTTLLPFPPLFPNLSSFSFPPYLLALSPPPHYPAMMKRLAIAPCIFPCQKIETRNSMTAKWSKESVRVYLCAWDVRPSSRGRGCRGKERASKPSVKIYMKIYIVQT